MLARKHSILRSAGFLAMFCSFALTPIGYAGPAERHVRSSERVTSSHRINEYEDVTVQLEELRKWLEEWGSVTASAPIIMYEHGQFSLDRELSNDSKDQLTTRFKSTQQHITDAAKAVSGRASQSTVTGLGNSVNLEVTPLLRFGVTNSAPSVSPAASAGPTATPAPLPSPPGENELKPPDFGIIGNDIKADLPVAPLTDLAPTSQQSILIGTNSKITELLMRAMADPAKRDFTNPGKSVHMAIVQVSCNPGWRTRENYVADITANCEYYNSQTRQVAPDYEGRSPLVFSVLPLIDAQTLELQNSQRQIADLAAQISAAFPTKAANFRAKDLMRFIRDYKSSIATKTPRTISNSYSSGNSFGFRFTPSLVALKDPTERRSPSANILQSTVLPVLVTIVVDQGWIHDHGYNSVMVHVANRWLLNDRPPLRQFWRRFGRPMKRETTQAREELAARVQNASISLNGFSSGSFAWNDMGTNSRDLMVRRDLRELSAKVVGSSSVVFAFQEDRGINEPGHPVIRSVQPSAIPAGHTTRLAIWGDGFRDDCTVYLNGVPAGALTVASGGRQLVCTVELPANTVEGSGDATVIVESGGSFDTFPVRVWKPSAEPPRTQ